MAQKKRKLISFRTILSVATVGLVGYVIYQNWPDMVETFYHLGETNIAVLLLLIPEQIVMYYACGQIFFSYLVAGRAKGTGRTSQGKNASQGRVAKISAREKLLISTELNFVNHAVPAGGLGGLAYLMYRLGPYGVSAGQASFLYIFRYAVTTVVNYGQALVAIVILLMMQAIPEEATWIIPVSLLMNLGVAMALSLVVFVASSRKRIEFFSRTVTGIANGVVRVVSLGCKRKVISRAKMDGYFSDIHESVKLARREKRRLVRPLGWGVVYSFFEVATYWIVAMSLGRPELLPFILVGEAIGSVFDGIVPYGLYELGMVGVMIALGVDFPTATIVTVMTRVLTLVLTIVTGTIPYYRAIRRKK